MENENSFQYTYSAPVNQEVLNIRKIYLPKEENEPEEPMRQHRRRSLLGIGIGMIRNGFLKTKSLV